MAKQIARLLKADIQESSDLKSIAKMLSKKGRGGDTMLAHITPKEAAILKENGGAGTVNPDTGLLEFYDWSGGSYVDDTYYSASPSSNMQFDLPPASSAPNINMAFLEPDQVAPADPSGFPYTNLTGAAASQWGMTPEDESSARFPGEINYQKYAEIPPSAGQVTQPFAMTYQGTPVEPTDPGLAAKTKSALSEYVGEPLRTARDATGIGGTDLLRLGIAGAGVYAGRRQAQQAAKQIERATQEQKQLGAPYQQKGQELQRAAMAGELTPQSAQAYQALRAQMAQGIESRGGVGVAQAQAQLEAFRQNLLQNQYNFGLQVAQIGDNMALGAIRTGMQLDQQLAAANQQFYTQLAAIAGGGTYGTQPQTTGGR